MYIPQCPSFIHIHSYTHDGQRVAANLRETPENVLIARLASDLLVGVDSAWIIGLMRTAAGVDVIGIFSDSGDPAQWAGYANSISVCARAETPAVLDAQLRSHNIVPVLFPIETAGQDLAVIAIGPRNKRRSYSVSDVSVMRELCGEAGNMLRAQASTTAPQDDFETVRSMQDRLLPACLPCISGLECSGQCERSGQLGGDFFDLSGSTPGGLMAAIGNVATTGNPGCVLMTGLQACLRALGHRGVALPDLFGEVNRMFWEIAPESAHATLFSAHVDPACEQLHYVNAGHQTSLIIRRDGQVDRLEPNAAVLGLSRRTEYRQRKVHFGPGDTLIALSDGIAEPVRESAVIQMVRHDPALRVRELPARIIELVESFAGAFASDRTVIVVHFRNPDSGDASRHLRARFDHTVTAAA